MGVSRADCHPRADRLWREPSGPPHTHRGTAPVGRDDNAANLDAVLPAPHGPSADQLLRILDALNPDNRLVRVLPMAVLAK